jgi:hypothetical protein
VDGGEPGDEKSGLDEAVAGRDEKPEGHQLVKLRFREAELRTRHSQAGAWEQGTSGSGNCSRAIRTG